MVLDLTKIVNFEDREKISQKFKIAFGLGNMGSFILSGLFNSSCVKFYTDKIFLAPGYIGLAFLIFAIWNALNDPIFGHLSDKTRTKIGRRIPYLRVMSFTYGISFILLWIPPSGSQLDLFLYLLITILFFDTCYTFFGLCISALLPELSLDPNERTKLSLYATAFGAIGSIISFVVPFVYLTKIGGKGEFQFICLILAIATTVMFFICSFTIEERKDFYEDQESLGLIDAVKYCLKNKAFICFVIFNFGLTIISSGIYTVILYYTQYVLHLSGSAAFLPLIIILIGFLITYSLTPRINKKFGIRKSLMIMGVFGIFGFLLTLIPNLIVAIIAFSIVASSIAVYAILVNPMIADICDEDELQTGLRREGAYFGVNALIVKPAVSLGVFIITFILEYSGYFPQLTEYFGYPQSVGVEIGIRIAMGLVPAIFLGMGLITLYFYPLHGEYYIKLKEEIKRRHTK